MNLSALTLCMLLPALRISICLQTGRFLFAAMIVSGGIIDA